MQFDVNNQQMLQAGASSWAASPKDWRPMSEAPRDGTWIEIKNSYGVAPSYRLARWTNKQAVSYSATENGQVIWKTREIETNYAWLAPDGGGYISEGPLTWRPYNGDVKTYADPTGGAQNSAAYWRGAVAAKYGLPLNFFEVQTARNLRK